MDAKASTNRVLSGSGIWKDTSNKRQPDKKLFNF